MDPHRRAERRSLVYHRAIAARLDEDPALLDRARSRVVSWDRSGDVHPRYRELWRSVLSLPLDELKAELVAETEGMMAARQSSPFAGALSARERWKLWRTVGP